MKNTTKRLYTFDITIGEEIFRHLYANNIIKVKGNHKILSAPEIKEKTFVYGIMLDLILRITVLYFEILCRI